MAQPTGSDLHVNGPLTNISIAYMQSTTEFIADRVFPTVPVSMASDLYYKYDKGNWFRTSAAERAPATESVGTGYTTSQDSYSCRVYAVHKDVADQDRARADSQFNLDRDATELVTRDLLLQREKKFVSSFINTSIWGTDVTGVAAAPTGAQVLQWNDASSTPIEDIRKYRTAVAQTTGFRPNKLVLGPLVRDTLLDHPDIVDRIKYTTAGGAKVSLGLLASLFEVDEILVPEVVQNTAAEGAADSLAFLYGKFALLVYAAPSPSLMMPSAGYIFGWSGLLGGSAFSPRISRFRMENIKSDRVEGEIAYDMKKVAADLGVYFTTVIA